MFDDDEEEVEEKKESIVKKFKNYVRSAYSSVKKLFSGGADSETATRATVQKMNKDFSNLNC
jgi:hypothetical protein